VMKPYFPKEKLRSPLLDQLIDLGVRGGQNADGSQKNGFFKYEKNRLAGIFDPERQAYVPLTEIQAGCDGRLGPLPKSAISWKAAVAHPDKENRLGAHFAELQQMESVGASLAKRYCARSRAIGNKLVADGVARCEADVNTVLLTGFFHAYGPINPYLTEEVKS